ncbi:MAG: hypothetical protein FJ288_19530 [Planctomycetes bacterium]|nr:hypothetical protein [Planctomycetota bacterium]
MPRPRSALAATRAACTVPPDRPLRPPRRPRGRPAGAAPPQDAAFAGPDWVGFDIPDGFVIGYGLDYRGRYRNLPCLAVLRPRKGSC